MPVFFLDFKLKMGKNDSSPNLEQESPMGNSYADASKMLEAALQQMDGIIAGK